MPTTRDAHLRPLGTARPAPPERDPDAPPVPRRITEHDIEWAPDDELRDALKARYAAQLKADTEAPVPAPVPPPTGDLLPSLTAKEQAAGERFGAAIKAVSKLHPARGFHLTWGQLDSLREEDPDGFAAWSRATRILNLRFR